MDKQAAYKILVLQDGASEEDIKTAYLELATKYSPENYDSGPLHEDANKKMEELNTAFDVAISFLHTGKAPVPVDAAVPAQQAQGYAAGAQTDGTPWQSKAKQATSAPAASAEVYAQIRQLINTGKADEALAELNAIASGAEDAEWNFLVGSVYYHKGWLSDALFFFSTANRLDPSNKEYSAALKNLTSRGSGEMPGSPYKARQNSGDDAAVDCACSTCNMLCCMDMCCRFGRGC